MRYAGVTGTNGKTTITYLFEAMAKAAGTPIGLLGTVEQRIGDHRWPATHTTLESIALCERLQEMEKIGAAWAVLEVSSHALAQKRADALRFSVSAFTNLTPDHLDFHKTFEAYFLAKARLFAELTTGVSVIHTGAAYGERMASLMVRGERLLVGRDRGDVQVEKVELGRESTRLQLQTPLGPLSFETALIGEFNVENVLVAVGMAIGAGFSAEAIVRGCQTLPGVPGRLERVRAGARAGFVDYAHTPDALERVLKTLQALPHERLFCVFGCGGDRDPQQTTAHGSAPPLKTPTSVSSPPTIRAAKSPAIIDAIVSGMVR